MSRLAASFERLAAAQRKALIPYITAGHPTREVTVPVMHAMVAAGADAIELGVPFSDPMADGPVIQRANEAALARGIRLRDVLDNVRAFRESDDLTPVVLMGYANPIERMGIEAFLTAARDAGVDGLIVVDYPPEESESFAEAAKAAGLDLIFLLAPTSTDKRIDEVGRLGAGYVYYVSLNGITGAGNLDTAEVAQRVRRIKRSTPLPVGVGFGIRDAATAKAIAAQADAVIIGSKMIQVLEDGDEAGATDRATAFIATIREALDELTPAEGGASANG
ncbi:MAG: tryptophan synthase alpha subunit [Pseudomonadota bacterium]|jgi:tryptophan synthase alpha chain